MDLTTETETTENHVATTQIEKIARAFSSHRFDQALTHLADDVVWTLVGDKPLIGRKAVKKACERTAADLAGVTTEFQRFRTVVGDESVVVDSLARYTGSDGEVSIVASCDVYDFDEERITEIVSYTVELPS
ncbi:nuclear transport factor 2 family protein [Agromyces sp. NPDC049794]|uniref:nuclear transport factor 2 family protein n=1 Tax=unclassified Agromyces TaxID=2639701 RepID=UPI0033FC81D9